MARIIRSQIVLKIVLTALTPLLALAGLTACGTDNIVPSPYTEVGGGGQGTHLDPADGPTWKIIPAIDGVFEAELGSHVQLPFQVTRDGVAMAAEVVRFELRAGSATGTLVANFDLTRENGVAGAELDIGEDAGELVVVATHALGGIAELPVTVVEPPVVEPLPATLRVGVLYASQSRWPVDEVNVRVVPGIDCAGLEAGTPLAPYAEQLLADLTGSLLFTRVLTDTPLAIEATGTLAGVAFAHGCVDGLTLAPEENGGVVVRLLPDGLDPTGTWDVAHDFDFGNALPGDLGGVFTVLDQLFNDPDDPARYLVTWIEAELGINLGPLEAIAINLLDQQLKSVIPQGVQGLFQRVGEAARLVTKFGIDAEMIIAQDLADPRHQLMADETWKSARFVWKGQTERIDLAAAGLPETRSLYPVQVADEARLLAPTHTFEIPFTGLYRVVLTNLVFPDLGNGATTTHGLLASVIDCVAVADRIDASDGTADGQLDLGLVQIPAADLTASCDTALTYVADQIDAKIDGLAGSGPSKLTLDGIADIAGDDGKRHPQRLEAGQWTGDLDLSGSPSVVSGTFDGTRRP